MTETTHFGDRTLSNASTAARISTFGVEGCGTDGYRETK